MKPTTITDEQILEGHTRITMGPPIDDTDVESVHMCTQPHTNGGMIFRARVELEPGDLERLAAGEPFWISFWGHVVPFDVAMADLA